MSPRVLGTVCELNPLHRGHARLLSFMREAAGPDGIVVCAMSGHATQRGEAALLDPYLRAKTALLHGADLVAEVPFPWSCGAMEHFALGGVWTLSGLGVDTLCFGSESGDGEHLRTLSAMEDAKDLPAAQAGMGTPQAFAKQWQTLAGEVPGPNDRLGIAYLRAAEKLGLEWNLQVVKRPDTHHLMEADGENPSSAFIRRCLREKDPAWEACVPSDVKQTLLAPGGGPDPSKSEELLFAYYRLTPAGIYRDCSGMGGGVAQRVEKCAAGTADYASFFSALRTKKYTDSFFRRTLLFGMTGVREAQLKKKPSYFHLLGLSSAGQRYLSGLKKDLRHVLMPARLFDRDLTQDGREQHRAELAMLAWVSAAYEPGLAAGDLEKKHPVLLGDACV
ncbi:MAG: nucleotidyltransferase family protein [Clostridia bacterium]|nr:nucleotidyltransferase family protein [Clostridia bacterium]